MVSIGASRRIKQQIPRGVLQRVRILNLWIEGLGVTYISRDGRVNMTRQAVHTWVKRFREGYGTVPDEVLVLDRPRSGRPHKLSTAVKKLIVKRAEGKQHRSLRKTAAWLRTRGTDVGKDTVATVLKQAGLYPYRRQKVPRLSDLNKKQRKKFARDRKNHDWSKTLFTDEKNFELFAATNPQNDRIWAQDPSTVPRLELVQKAT